MARHPRRPVNVPLLSASIAGGLLIVALIVAWASPPPPPSQPRVAPLPDPTPPVAPPLAMQNLTIVPAGTSYLIPGGAFVDVLFHLTMSANLAGGYIASGNVSAEILSATAFQSFETSGDSDEAAWSATPAPGGSVSLVLPAGTYYLVFADFGASVPVTVDSPSGILAAFPLPG